MAVLCFLLPKRKVRVSLGIGSQSNNPEKTGAMKARRWHCSWIRHFVTFVQKVVKLVKYDLLSNLRYKREVRDRSVVVQCGDI